MATIIMFHSVYGLRRGVFDAEAHFRRNGHAVYTPDLSNGMVFDDLDAASKFAQEIGIPRPGTSTDSL
jgi:hypothetical protein